MCKQEQIPFQVISIIKNLSQGVPQRKSILGRLEVQNWKGKKKSGSLSTTRLGCMEFK